MLQETLKLLFQEQNPEMLLKTLTRVQENAISPDRAVDKKSFIYHASRCGVKGSLDQLEIQLNVINDFYFQKPEDDFGLHFSRMPSVFNVLLHFCINKLIVNNREICCYYRNIDKWHSVTSRLGEDLFTTSYLAAYDLARNNRDRTTFGWAPYLGVETADVTQLFSHPIAELHAHLYGSSVNFDLSWLSLMNYPYSRERDFLDLFGEKDFNGESRKNREMGELYRHVAIAAAIRLYLFGVQNGLSTQDEEKWINDMVGYKTVEEFQPTLVEIATKARNHRDNRRNMDERGVIHDYAHDAAPVDLTSVLSGERGLL